MKKATCPGDLTSSVVDGQFTLDGCDLADPNKELLVWEDFNLDQLKLTSLVGFPSYVARNLYVSNNKLTNLHNIHHHIRHIGNKIDFGGNPITSHVLGLLKIESLVSVNMDNVTVRNIINKHLNGDKDVLDCAEELVEAGYEAYAQL